MKPLTGAADLTLPDDLVDGQCGCEHLEVRRHHIVRCRLVEDRKPADEHIM
ncbi:MAG: hypothetical protein U5K33_04210 [Halofilum sp. (in: g-proteobacteria)]|nr:hypothetical protein [Halofilum sp. (in: g-proteobacteria)]